MQSHIVPDFRMEGQGQLIFIMHGCHMAVRLGEDFDFGADFFDIGRADEVLTHRADMADVGFRDEAAELAAVGIAANRDGQGLKASPCVVAQMLREQDEPCTGREHGHAAVKPRFDGLIHARFHEDFSLYRAFAARQHEAVGSFP